MRTAVVLPAPFGPSTPRMDPAGTWRPMPARATSEISAPRPTVTFCARPSPTCSSRKPAAIVNLHTIHTFRADRRHVHWFCSADTRTSPRSSRVGMEVAFGLGSGPAPERLAVMNASRALFGQAASRGPLLIVIDDLHWLDRASGAAVGLPEYEVAPLSEADAVGLLARQFVHL